jgi:cell division GTPase FtsZ
MSPTYCSTLVVAVGNGAANIVDDTLSLQLYKGVDFIFADTQSSTLMNHGQSSFVI